MKKLVSLFAMLTWSLNAQAQSTFENVYLATGSFKLNLLELNSHNLVAAVGATGTGISLLDTEGTVIQSSYYWGDTLLNMTSIKKWTDNEFYYASGYYKDTCTYGNFGVITQSYPLIGRMDSLGTVLSASYYILNASGCIGLPMDLEILSDKSVIIWGGSNFILKADSLGVPFWARHFDNHGTFQFIKELPSGDLLAGVNLDTAGAVVTRLDSNGNFIWLKSYIRPKGMIHDCLIESDSSFIVTGYTDSIASTNSLAPLPTGYHPKLFMLKLNGAGDVQWCKGYDSDPNLWYARAGSSIVKAQDGNYVVLANLGIEGYNRAYRPFLMKTDQNGDTLWTRSAGANGYTYLTKDLLASADGGILYDGIVKGDLPGGWTGAPYIFKSDSLGHLPCLEQWHATEVSDLFPTDSSFTLSSVDGATMLPAFVGDTVFDPIAVYDACVITTVVDLRNPRSFKVYPNPTTGRITIQFADPLIEESAYSVYDTMGRLLVQRPCPKGKATEEVDLSRFGSGTYVIKLTTPEGVHTGRVMVR